MSFNTADLCDRHESAIADGRICVLVPGFRHFGGRRRFSGIVKTVKIFEDNGIVRTTLETFGEGHVLVIDGGASLRCALVGDQLADLAARNQWAGIVVNGCIRDSAAISSMDLGVLAWATHPRKTIKRNTGEANVPVRFGDALIRPGNWLYADEDGVVVSEFALT